MSGAIRYCLLAITVGCGTTQRLHADDLPNDPTAMYLSASAVLKKGEWVIMPEEMPSAACAFVSAPEPLPRIELPPPPAVDPGKLRFLNLGRLHLPSLPYFDFNRLIHDRQTWGYFVLRIVVSADRDMRLALISSGRSYYSYEWNGKRSALFSSNRWVEKFGRVSRLNLNKGRNTLVVMVVGYRGKCGIALSLSTEEVGRRAAAVNCIDTPLRKYIYSPGEAIDPTSDYIDSVVALSPKLAPGNVGIAKIALTCASGKTMEDRVAVVDRNSIETSVNAILARARHSVGLTADVGLFSERLKFLLNPVNRDPEKLVGERDLVDMIGELDRIRVASASPGVPDWLAGAGRHFATFSASPGAARQPYMFYLPRAYEHDHKCPVVVVYPSSSAFRPRFSESLPIDYYDLVQSYVAAAELNGSAVIWPYGGNLEHSSITEEMVLDTINAAVVRFGLDEKRVLIIGACGAGRDALIFAARHSSRVYAAAAQEVTVDPLRASAEDRSGDLAPLTPLDFVPGLARIRIFLSHGAMDRHVPVNSTLRLAAALEASGCKPVRDILQGADEAYFPTANNQWIKDALSYFVTTNQGGMAMARSESK